MKNSVTICLWIISILFICLFWSCGSRKVHVEKQKEETKTEITDKSISETKKTENVKTETKTIVDDKNESVTTETTYKPEDPTKEAYIIEKDGTKTILGNSSKTVKTETKKNNIQTNTEEKKEEAKQADSKQQNNVGISQEVKKESKQKQSENTRIPVWYWVIGFIILVVIYTSYRIYKKLPINPF